MSSEPFISGESGSWKKSKLPYYGADADADAGIDSVVLITNYLEKL